ncbi:MAG: hypothetical protein P4L41_05975 [Flavipsychrobacter sp.]|nr:hypothetical protein [Flavipsychrobacter sp.]
MRTRKPTNGRVAGVKFALNTEVENDDLKKVKAQILKELEEKEKNNKEWYDKEMDKNLKKS